MNIASWVVQLGPWLLNPTIPPTQTNPNQPSIQPPIHFSFKVPEFVEGQHHTSAVLENGVQLCKTDIVLALTVLIG